MGWLSFEANLPASWSAATLLQSGTYMAPQIRSLISLATATDSKFEESDPFADVEEDEGELEENNLFTQG